MRTKTNPRLHLIAAGAIALSATDCGLAEFLAPGAVRIATPGVAVKDEDGDVSIPADSSVDTPFDARGRCTIEPTTRGYEDDYEDADAIQIDYPGLSKPLYGRLYLCRIPDTYKGPAASSYELNIPQSHVDATSGGRVSVVFEPFHCEYTRGAEGSEIGWQDYSGTCYAWILWLARQPI